MNPKQEKFALEYLRTGNGKQSAISAGYARRTAEVTASRLLRNDKVKKYIESVQDSIRREAEGSFKWTLDLAIKTAKACFDKEQYYVIPRLITEICRMQGFYKPVDFRDLSEDMTINVTLMGGGEPALESKENLLESINNNQTTATIQKDAG